MQNWSVCWGQSHGLDVGKWFTEGGRILYLILSKFKMYKFKMIFCDFSFGGFFPDFFFGGFFPDFFLAAFPLIFFSAAFSLIFFSANFFPRILASIRSPIFMCFFPKISMPSVLMCDEGRLAPSSCGGFLHFLADFLGDRPENL